MALYQRFLTKPFPRAVAIAPNGIIAATDSGFDPIATVLAACGRHSQRCQLYAIDKDVVWVRPYPAPPPTNFAALTDVEAVPYIPATARAGYMKFLSSRKPRAFVISPDGAWFAASRGTDPVEAATDACDKQHPACRPYAVDDDVVWPMK